MTSFNRGKTIENTERDERNIEKQKESEISSDFTGIAYSMFGDYFENKKGTWWYQSVEDKLVKARIKSEADSFLASTTLSISLLGVLLFVLVFFSMLAMFVIGSLNSFVGPLLFVLFFGGFFYVILGYIFMYYYLIYKVVKRKDNLKRTFPYGVTFIYSMSKGGLSFPDIIEKLARSEDSYGEISNELKPVVKEMKYFSKDLPTTMRESGRRTPLNKYNNFVNDLVGIVDSGASLSTFLEEKSKDYLQEIEREQKEFLDNLGVVAEIYVAGFLAAPLFILIVLIIMNMLQSGGINSVALFVYGGLSFANFGFYLFIASYTPDNAGIKSTIEFDDDTISYKKYKERYSEIKRNSEIVDEIMEKKRRKSILNFLKSPKEKLIQNPKYSLYFTIPLTLFYLGIIFTLEATSPSLSKMIQNPEILTGLYVVIPITILGAPISIFHEIKYRKKNKLLNKLPGTFQQISGTNSIGLTLSEGIETVRETTTGYLEEELRLVQNDLRWNHDVGKALKAFANRVNEPILVRTVKLITEANKSTGNISEVLEIAAKDVKNTQKLKKDRKSEMKVYAAIVVISFIIYIFVVVSLNSSFFDRIEDLGSQAGGINQQQVPSSTRTSAFDLSSLPVDKYRTILFHSTIIQGFGAGIIAGYLIDDSIESGIKYAIPLIIFSTIVFYIFV